MCGRTLDFEPAMTTFLYAHDACLDHQPGTYHPERPARLEAIEAALAGPAFAALERVPAPEADPSRLELVHPARHVDRILAMIPAPGAGSGRAEIDADTAVSPGSREAALRAAGAVLAGVDAVYSGAARNAFCSVRPPGHHAEPDRAMGFCLFNSVAVGARYAQAEHGATRVAVVDFDVHHGNGTQAAFEHDASLFYASSHQWPLYPGTGSPRERGVGNIVNACLPALSGSAEFRAAMENQVLPALDLFAPDLLLVSAGFDGHRDDPLATLNLVEDDYRWITEKLMAVADRHCGGRLVSALEGGYDLDALGRSAAAHVAALMEVHPDD